MVAPTSDMEYGRHKPNTARPIPLEWTDRYEPRVGNMEAMSNSASDMTIEIFSMEEFIPYADAILAYTTSQQSSLEKVIFFYSRRPVVTQSHLLHQANI